MWQGNSKGTDQLKAKKEGAWKIAVPEQVGRARSEVSWENRFVNMVKIMEIYEHGKKNFKGVK
jgi:hypothetical protein